MAKFELKLPKMGESVVEAILTSWLIDIGDSIEVDDGIVEVSTDKVDTEIPSEVSGVLIEKRFEVDAVIKVGETIAVIETKTDIPVVKETKTQGPSIVVHKNTPKPQKDSEIPKEVKEVKEKIVIRNTNRFYSPLIRNIAQKEGISQEELDQISTSGKNKRLTKDDVLSYLENRKTEAKPIKEIASTQKTAKETVQKNDDFEIVPMDRMGKLIAEHMIHSIQTSAHVQSFIEIDVTKIVEWRNNIKEEFIEMNGEKITFTPIFMQSIAQTIREFPMVNVSVDGNNIIKKKHINLGMAAALPDGNLIVPVIKDADQLDLIAMIKKVNSLASKARNGKLSPDDIQGGTYTVTNVGSFGSITGTPIINQPQVAILALGAIRKMPTVVESPEGDSIEIRHQMIVAHSYDHRVVNGALGGQFILRLKEIIENFDTNQSI